MILNVEKSNIKEFIVRKLIQQKLIGKDSTVIVTGSCSVNMSLEKGKFDRYFNGESDIDLIVVLNKEKEFLEEKFEKNVILDFENGYFDVLNYSCKYHIGRNVFNIKYIKKENFPKICSFSRINFRSFRKHSLKCKKNTKMYGEDGYINFKYIEKSFKDYYILEYNIDLNHKYYITDIHSMLLFGKCLLNPENIIYEVIKFNRKFLNYYEYYKEKNKYMFKYFVEDKKLFNKSEISDMIYKSTYIDLKYIFEILENKKIIIDTNFDKSFNKDFKICNICWARNNPKDVFGLMEKIGKILTKEKFIFLVDDICPMVLYGRTKKEQERINIEYKKKLKNSNLYFSSEIFGNKSFIIDFLKIIDNINLSYYLSFLPEKKRNNLNKMDLSELLHSYFEIKLIEYAVINLKVDILLFGKFSQNILFLAKDKILTKKIKYIIIDKIDEKLIKDVF